MKISSKQTLIVLAGSLVAGGAVGLCYPSRNGDLSGSPTHQIERGEGDSFVKTPAFENQSQTTPFHTLDLEKQAAFLKRLALKSTVSLPLSKIVLLAKLISTLSADQVEALLKDPPSGKIEQNEIRSTLVERLADLDPKRAFEVAQNLGEKSLLVRVLSTVAEQDLKNALQLAQGLSKDQAKPVLISFFDELNTRPVAGSPEDMARGMAGLQAFKEFDFKAADGAYVGQTIGYLLAETAKTDPASAVLPIKSIMAELAANRKQDGDPSFPEDRIAKHVVNGAMNRLRQESSPQAASAFFEAIPDASKTAWMFNWEAQSLVRTGGGVEAAIALAEKQKDPAFIKEAAKGTWMGLALQDRQSAFSWIESLPKGPFRDGVLESVEWEGGFRSFDWSRPAASIAAGASLLSEQSRMDYYAAMISGGHFGPVRPTASELIPQLPISDDQKQSLYRRFAPIKAK